MVLIEIVLNIDVHKLLLESHDHVSINIVDLLVWGSSNDLNTEVVAQNTLAKYSRVCNGADLVSQRSLLLHNLLRLTKRVIHILCISTSHESCLGELGIDIDTSNLLVTLGYSTGDGSCFLVHDFRLQKFLLGVYRDHNVVVVI